MTQPEVAPAKRTFWQRRIVDPVVAQLTQGITPEKIALTVAVGGACALFPIFGLTTLLCFLVALVLRLNQPIIQLLNQALWPVHLPVILWLVRLGEIVFGVPHQRFRPREMYHLFWEDTGLFFEKFGTTALHAVVAWALLAPFFIALCYYPLLPLMRAIDRIHREQKAKHSAALQR